MAHWVDLAELFTGSASSCQNESLMVQLKPQTKLLGVAIGRSFLGELSVFFGVRGECYITNLVLRGVG